VGILCGIFHQVLCVERDHWFLDQTPACISDKLRAKLSQDVDEACLSRSYIYLPASCNNHLRLRTSFAAPAKAGQFFKLLICKTGVSKRRNRHRVVYTGIQLFPTHLKITQRDPNMR
jgi:hypothetical protein